MPQITNEATLIAEVATRLGRSDFDAATAALPIQMAVLQIQRDATNSGAFIGLETTTTGNLTIGNEALAVPVGFQQVRAFELLAPFAVKLMPEPLPTFIDVSNNINSGIPERYAVFGSNFILNPIPASNYPYRLRWVGVPTVAFLTANHPDLIFYATLLQASDNARDVEAIEKYTRAYGVALQAAMSNEQRDRFGNMPPQLTTNPASRFNIAIGR